MLTLQEQFHIGMDTPLQNKKTNEVAVRANTHFVAFQKENINTGGNAALVRKAMIDHKHFKLTNHLIYIFTITSILFSWI